MIYVFSHDVTFSAQMIEALPGRRGESYTDEARLASTISENHPDGILFDMRSGARPFKLLERVFLERPDIAVIVVQPPAGISEAFYSDRGLFWPVEPVEIARVFDDIADERKVIDSCGLVGRSSELASAARIVMQVAPTDINVLITGPSGAGKEMIARAIHAKSVNPESSFIPVNVAALAPGIVESELFGHEKGSFTGASSRRIGVFEQASGGIIFLDEIAEIPIEVQAKLLRVLEERTFTRVGGNVPIRADFRLVAATNRELTQDVSMGRFREDLFYRLRVVSIDLPPLSQRKSDIAPLAHHFLGLRSKELKTGKLSVELGALKLFQRYDWPGNVRELKNVIDSFSVTTPSGRIRAEDFEKYMQERAPKSALLPMVTGRSPQAAEHQLMFQAIVALTSEVTSLRRLIEQELERTHAANVSYAAADSSQIQSVNIEDAEEELVSRALTQTGGNRKKAARLLGIGERTLYRKMDRYGLK